MDVRQSVIDYWTERIDAIAAEAGQIVTDQTRALTDPALPVCEPDAWSAVEVRDFFRAVAYRGEQLREEITGALLFDRLDAEDEALRVATEAAGSVPRARQADRRERGLR